MEHRVILVCRSVQELRVGSIAFNASHLLAGEYVESSSSLEVLSPIDQTAIGNVAAGGSDAVDAAVQAARAAFPAWRDRTPEYRRQKLLRFAELIREHSGELAQIESTDTGGLLHVLEGRVVERSATNIEFFADWAAEHGDSVCPGGANTDLVRREPAGVAALITPWNAPLMLTTWKIGPALAAGNSIIVKPPELAPASCAFLGKLSLRSGLPPGVFNIVHGDGASAGQALVEHPQVDRISFTGSPATGRKIAATAARHLTPVSLELGGKSPLIACASADLGKVADAIAHQYFNAGQVCLAGTRILAHRSISDTLLEAVRTRVERLVVGDPRQRTTDVGPLISLSQAQRVDGFVERAVASGAEIAWGGRPAPAGDTYYLPTMILGAEQHSEIVQNEVFGPVLTWQTFDDEDHAVHLANDTRYGLAASIWTNDRPEAERVGRAVRAGTVWVNSFYVRNLAAPFGGSGESGIGVEGGDWSLDFYSDIKNLSVDESSFGA